MLVIIYISTRLEVYVDMSTVSPSFLSFPHFYIQINLIQVIFSLILLFMLYFVIVSYFFIKPVLFLPTSNNHASYG